MKNSNYAAEQIIEMLIKRGWVSTDAYNVNNLISDISTIIINESIVNIDLPTFSNCDTTTFSNCDTTTFSINLSSNTIPNI